MSGFSLVLSCLPANLLFEHWKFYSLQSAAAAAAAAYDDKPRTLLLLAKQNVSNKYPSDKWSSLKVRGRSNAISFSSLCLESCWNKSCFFFLECFFQLNVNSKIFFIEILCLFIGELHCDNMSTFLSILCSWGSISRKHDVRWQHLSRMKVMSFWPGNVFCLNQNASSYIWDQCCHLQRDGASLRLFSSHCHAWHSMCWISISIDVLSEFHWLFELQLRSSH